MHLGIRAIGFGPTATVNLPLIKHAESLGFTTAWTAEAYGNAAATPAAWVLAHTESISVGTGIMQIHARTPALAAMTAMTLDQLSGGRFILGLGPSGPQVVESWHGVPYGRLLTRTREYMRSRHHRGAEFATLAAVTVTIDADLERARGPIKRQLAL